MNIYLQGAKFLGSHLFIYFSEKGDSVLANVAQTFDTSKY